MLVFTILKRSIYNTYVQTYLGFSYKKIIKLRKPIKRKRCINKILKDNKNNDSKNKCDKR